MVTSAQFEFRRGVSTDALCLSALATQVFFDTYAIQGINADLVNEAGEHYSQEALAGRLSSPGVDITLVEYGGNIVGFIDVQISSLCPVPSVVGPEVLRLYIQLPFQNKGLGKQLLLRAERTAYEQGARALWLTAWVGNVRAMAFYPLAGYEKFGTTQYLINGNEYENCVFAKWLPQNGT
jgi:GNAT superfamily N-acetyltransferase